MTAPATEVWLCPDRLFDGTMLHSGLALGVAGGMATRIAPPPAGPCMRVSGTLSPGFIDLQVNGGGDVLLNAAPTAEAMQAIAAAHRRFGTTAILPTVISDTPEVLARVVGAALQAKSLPGLLGLHIEGPHLALSRRGAHRADVLRPLDATTLAHIRRLRVAGIAVMITLAPEAATSAQIASLAALGAVVSIGHSNATAEQANAALAAGARCFTHLFNAMSQMEGRRPGVTGAALTSTAHVGIICDGHHVADAMVGLAVRSRPVPDRCFLVSDAMPTVGGSDRFRLDDREVRLVAGRLQTEDGTLAGAHLTMAQAVARLITVVGIAPDIALRMATSVPARLIGAPQRAILPGQPLSDLLILDADWQVTGTCAGLY